MTQNFLQNNLQIALTYLLTSYSKVNINIVTLQDHNNTQRIRNNLLGKAHLKATAYCRDDATFRANVYAAFAVSSGLSIRLCL